MKRPLLNAAIVLVSAYGFPVLAEDERKEIPLPEGENGAQIFLTDYPSGTRFNGWKTILVGGESQHFKFPPKFALLNSKERKPEADIGYPDTDDLEAIELPDHERYPLQMLNLENPTLFGVTVRGVQSKDLPWRVIKAMWDGDALHVKECSGRALVSDVFFDNVEDGFGPMEGLEFWTLKNAYMRSIRDDAIENDDLISGEIVNCLIDGCYMFLSEQNEEFDGSGKRSHVRIRDCLVHVQPQPHDGVTGKAYRDSNIRIGEDGIGRAPGALFKWFRGAGTVDVRNCVFRLDAVSFNGPGDMSFPKGTYENVTLVWLGKRPYPVQPLPRGVKLTTDIKVWEEAREEWIRKLPDEHPAAKVLKEG